MLGSKSFKTMMLAALLVFGALSSNELRRTVKPQFEKQVIETRFISEGVAVGDVNRDKKLDVIAGNVWYEAPSWKAHEIAPAPLLDPKTQYSTCFHCWMQDLNRDGWADEIVIGMPGEKAVWRENPKGAA